MPKTLLDVQQEYEDFRLRNPQITASLQEFAQGADRAEGASERASAYDPKWYNRLNAFIDRGFQATGIPDVGGVVGREVGEGVDKFLGTEVASTLEGVGESTPRMITEGLATLPLGGGSLIARGLGGLGKILGYGSAATRGYDETDSVLGAGISAGSLALGNKLLLPKEMGGVDVGGRVRTRLQDLLAPKLVPGAGLAAASTAEKFIPGIAGVGADVATATGINEATRQASLTVMPDEMRAEGDRNPFTQENIAGNVAGAAFFTPQIVSALRNRPRVSIGQAKQLHDFIQKNEDALTEMRGEVPEVRVEDTLLPDANLRDRHEALYGMIDTALNAAGKFDKIGDVESATRARTNALNTIDEAANGRFSPMPSDLIEKIKVTVDNEARMQPPSDPKNFELFVNEVRGIVDMFADNLDKYREELAQRQQRVDEQPRGSKSQQLEQEDFVKWKDSWERNIGKTWHPQAKTKEVVDRLWKNGSLPPLSPQWLSEEFHLTLEDSGNLTFAERVVAQKVANYAIDNMDAALARDAVVRKANAETGAQLSQKKQDVVAQYNKLDHDFIRALTRLPQELRRDLERRSVELRSDEFQKRKTGVTESRYAPWQEALVGAAVTFDPETRTIMLPIRNGGKQRVSVDTLTRRDANGKYVWEPNSRVIPKVLGGKAKVGTETDPVTGKPVNIYEGNIEAIPVKDPYDAASALDEDTFKQTLAESSQEPTQRGQFGTIRIEGEDSPAIDMPDEVTVSEAALGDRMSGASKQINKALDALTDAQLWALARNEFRSNFKNVDDPRSKNLKLAVRAAMEGFRRTGDAPVGPNARAFYEAEIARGLKPTTGKSEKWNVRRMLVDYFQSKTPVEGGDGKLPPHEERLARVVRKLLDPQTVERARTGIKARRTVAPNEITPDDTQYRDMLKPMSMRDAQAYFDLGYPVYRAVNDGEFVVRVKDMSEFTTSGSSEPSVLINDTIKLSGTGTNDSPGTIVNEPRADAFVGDIERTFRAWTDKHLGRAGYSGSSREFMVEVAVALARQTPNLDFYRIVGPEYGLAGVKPGFQQDLSARGKLGLNMDRAVAPGDEFRAVQQMLQTLAHEITHMDGYIRDGLVPRPDAYSDERTRLLNNLDHLAKNLNDDERLAILTVLNESIPEQYRTKLRQEDGRLYGTSNPDEFVAEVVSKTVMMLANDTVAGRAAAKEALTYGPSEVREIARDGFRTIRDTMLAMREAVSQGRNLTARTDPFILATGFEVLLDGATVMTDFKQAEQTLALARQAVANIDTGGGSRPPARMTDAVWFREQHAIVKAMKDAPVPSQTTIEALNEVQDRVFSPTAYDAKYKPNAFVRWFYPFANKMSAMERQGVTLARPVLEAVFDLSPGISRLYSSFLGDFLKREANGDYDFDKEHSLVRLVSEEKSGPWRDGTNAVSAWQNENNSQPMFVKDAQGTIIVNPDPKLKAQEAWDRIRRTIPKDQQQHVMGANHAFDVANQRAGASLVYHLQQSNVATIATYIMAANKRMPYDQARAVAQRVHDAYLSGNVASLNGTAPPEQLAALQRLIVGTPTKESPLGDGILAKFVEVKNMMDARTGFRSESLPHDWIIKYEENGKVAFDSRPTKDQAQYLANRIVGRGGRIHGEILNRKEMRGLTEFDHPDTILAKVAETETYVWNKFVDDIEQQQGTELATALREGYAPVAQSMRELGTAGLAKFLRKNRGLVDRTSYDYIDGQFAYLQRLSASIAMRDTQQQIRLILNDPRANFMPSFKKEVQEHIAETLSPQSDMTRQMKTFITTNFLGLNISSAVIDGTQSVTSLVPWLIAGIDARHPTKGGPAKAWKDMGVAMGDALAFATGKTWERTAASAKSKDPRTHTLDEALATAYKTHVENGGIQQTVIDDLVYGRDQRALMLAKFGHGNYGPTPVGKVIANGAYSVSQAMMSLYKVTGHFNARTAFFAGARQAFELGLRGEELYQYATKMQTLATYGGGRANAPGLVPKLSTQYTRSAVGVANTLQQYAYGTVAMYGQLMKDSIGQSKGLNAVQVRQAQKAFGTMLITQLSIAGALGLPFVGAAMTLMEKLFGIPATQAVREGLASLADDDEEMGAVYAETGMNGFLNQAVGLDVSSRLGVSNLLGTSSYRGFNLADMAGPVGSLVSNSAEALNLFGQQRPAEAMHKLVPAAFRNVIELSNTKAKYGDFGLRDASGALLYTPTDSQRLGYALGFRPRELSQKRAMQTMQLRADERTTARRDRELDGAAQSLLRGDPSLAQQLANDARALDPTTDPRDILRQVMDRGVAASTPKDILATGSRWNEEERRKIASTFGAGVNERQSEVENQNLRLQLAGMLGDPRLAPTAETYRRAAVIDHLVKSQGMTRSEATRLAEFLGL